MRCGSERRQARSRGVEHPVPRRSMPPRSCRTGPSRRYHQPRTGPPPPRWFGDVVQRGSLGALVARGHRRHPVRVHERSAPSRVSRAPTRRSKASPSADPGPAHEARFMRWASRRVRSKTSAEPVDRVRTGPLECPIQVDQVQSNVVTAKQRAGQGATPCENLLGKLAAQHQVIGDALAGRLFSERVERFDAGGGEREQVVVRTALHDERVAMPFAGRCDRGDRIADSHVPWQARSVRVGGAGTG